MSQYRAKQAFLENAKTPREVEELAARMSVILAESKRAPTTPEVHALMHKLAFSAYVLGCDHGWDASKRNAGG